MSFNFVIPSTLSEDEHMKPATFYQDVYGAHALPGCEIQGMRLAGKYDGFFTDTTAQGIGGVFVRAYNFTDKPIVMLDASNNAIILEPVLRMGGDTVDGEVIVVDIFHLTQDQRVSHHSSEYLKNRRQALIGSDLPDPTVDSLSGDFIHRANQNRMYRYYLKGTDDTFRRHEDAFYFEPGNIVLGTMKDINKILIHPKSDDALLKKARPKLESVKSLGAEIGVNDPGHIHDKLFTNVFGVVMEVPITRDAQKDVGITLWENVHQNNSQPVFYQLDNSDIPVKLFPSRKAAESGGAPEKQVEVELTQAKIELSKSKLEHDQKDHLRNLEKSALAREAEANKIIADAKAREIDQQTRERETVRKHAVEYQNNQLENVSFWRKVLIEGVKTIAAVAATASLFFGWYNKRKAA